MPPYRLPVGTGGGGGPSDPQPVGVGGGRVPNDIWDQVSISILSYGPISSVLSKRMMRGQRGPTACSQVPVIPWGVFSSRVSLRLCYSASYYLSTPKYPK